jgi:hypothetical protein
MFIVKRFYQIDNVITIRRGLQIKFEGRKITSKSAINTLINKCEKSGRVSNIRGEFLGRKSLSEHQKTFTVLGRRSGSCIIISNHSR